MRTEMMLVAAAAFASMTCQARADEKILSVKEAITAFNTGAHITCTFPRPYNRMPSITGMMAHKSNPDDLAKLEPLLPMQDTICIRDESFEKATKILYKLRLATREV